MQSWGSWILWGWLYEKNNYSSTTLVSINQQFLGFDSLRIYLSSITSSVARDMQPENNTHISSKCESNKLYWTIKLYASNYLLQDETKAWKWYLDCSLSYVLKKQLPDSELQHVERNNCRSIQCQKGTKTIDNWYTLGSINSKSMPKFIFQGFPSQFCVVCSRPFAMNTAETCWISASKWQSNEYRELKRIKIRKIAGPHPVIWFLLQFSHFNFFSQFIFSHFK